MGTMDRIVCYIPSHNDSELVAQSLASVPEWEVVISDADSDEPHGHALDGMAGDRVQVIHQPKHLGRVDNWQACVEHFIAGGADWMTFLPAGDRHKPDSLAACHRAVAKRCEAQLIVANIEMVWAGGRKVWSQHEQAIWFPPPQCLLQIAYRGNVFHGLLTNLIHSGLLRRGFTFGQGVLNCCADMFFDVNLARRCTTMFYPEVIAEFVADHRATSQAGRGLLEHLLEASLVRLRAADYYVELTADRQTRDAIVPQIALELRQALEQPLERLLGAQ